MVYVYVYVNTTTTAVTTRDNSKVETLQHMTPCRWPINLAEHVGIELRIKRRIVQQVGLDPL